MGYNLLPADTTRRTNHLRPDTVGILAPAEMGRRVGEVDNPVSDGALLRGVPVLRRLLRPVAVRYRVEYPG